MRRAMTKSVLFDAAIATLAAEGSGRLKLTTLCRRAGVTTGAFYHYFDGWQGFKLEFLDDWSARGTASFAGLSEGEPDPEVRVDLLVDFVCGLPHRAEAAIRSWAVSDDDVARSLAAVDEARLAIAEDILETAYGVGVRDQHVGTQALCFLIGYQHMADSLDTAFLRQGLRRLVEGFVEPAGR